MACLGVGSLTLGDAGGDEVPDTPRVDSELRGDIAADLHVLLVTIKLSSAEEQPECQ